MDNNTSTTKVPQMLCIKTDKGCFISDCFAPINSYDYDYHRTEIGELFFNGKKAEKTHYKNWYYIDEYPSLIQTNEVGNIINERYEINNPSFVSETLPAILPKKNDYDSNIIDNLYSFKYDREPPHLIEVAYDIQLVCEIENYSFPPKINYTGIHRWNYLDTKYAITNADVQHQILDQIIFPEIVLSNCPCKFTSEQMYNITRQYILDYIDNSVARVTSNYNFCFEVAKIIPLIEPKTITYTNIFAQTKRERNKVHTTIKSYNEKKIFSMTSAKDKYKGYPIIPELCANNETELKEKVDMWLESLIRIINEPLCQCPQCEGLGYINVIPKNDFDYKQ